MDDAAVRRLFAAILIRAAEDYRYLRKRGFFYGGDGHQGMYDREEVESFLKSENCEYMLRNVLGFNMHAKDLLATLNT